MTGRSFVTTQLVNLTGLIDPYTSRMGTLAFTAVCVCILVLCAIIGLAIWSSRNKAPMDEPDASGITRREQMDAIK